MKGKIDVGEKLKCVNSRDQTKKNEMCTNEDEIDKTEPRTGTDVLGTNWLPV